MVFTDFDLHPTVLAGLPSQLHTPTRIQKLAIPVVLAQRDLLALAQTGSGKTLAFGLPLLQQVNANALNIQVVVLVPTRELAVQVSSVLRKVATGLGIRIQTLCGGVDQAQQLTELERQPQFLVATPGRLLDLLTQELIGLDAVRHLVLDEADRLLEMGFWPDIQRLLTHIPAERQTLLFSATLPSALEGLAMDLLKDPLRKEAHAINSVVEELQERLYLVNKGSKAQALLALLKQHSWPQVLVFISTRNAADALCKKLRKAGVAVASLHGEKDQAVREQTLEDFKAHTIQVLVTTDLLARGIDVEALPVVINMDLPSSAPVYVHRVGRTARAGRDGIALSLVCHGEIDALMAIRDLTGRELTLLELTGFPVTDKPASEERKRPVRDKQANRRSSRKRSIKQFKSKENRTS
ncbi:DEAD/DEAH box helicase [Gammaproteobacteria bacterium 45_16_T64]|nr:DEAD/DEAH box helicase [Gammaproteobacteria bacterium 45_16_T64]